MGAGEKIDFNLSAAPIPDSQQILQLDLATIPNNGTFVGDTSEMNEDLDKLVEDLAVMIDLDGKIYSFLNLIS